LPPIASVPGFKSIDPTKVKPLDYAINKCFFFQGKTKGFDQKHYNDNKHCLNKYISET
jgi:hypothetical protein